MSIIHASPHPEIDIPEVTITAHVMQHAERLGDKPALIDGPSGRQLTYAELAAHTRAFAGGLRATHDFGPGHTLAVLLPNMPEYAVVFHGAAMTGGKVTTINPTYKPDEIRHQLEDAGADLLVTIEMFVDTAREAIEGTGIETIITIDGAEGTESYESLMGEPLTERDDVDLDDVVVLPYSSGTTGMPKGVMLTHRNLVSNIQQTLEGTDFTEDETSIAVLPFFHIYGMQVLMNSGLVAGATVITMPRFDLETFLELHQKHGVTRSFVAPPMVLALAKKPEVDDYDLSKLAQVFSGAAPLSADLAKEAADRIEAEVVQGYGMTEMSPVSHTTPPGRFKPGSAGITVANTECRIVDVESGEDLPIDEDGELWVRGPQVMAGYHENKEETDDTLVEDGWLRTGDVGHIDEDGHLYIVDRLKELIKFKGFQVPPAELESVLLTHDAVADSAVIGVDDEEAGEKPVGFVVLKPDAGDVSEQDIMDHVAEKVSTYKQLHRITFLDEIPKSASGKILRRELHDDHA